MAPEFDWVDTFHEGRALVRLGGLYGYVDTEGRRIVEPQYEIAGVYRGGLAEVSISDKTTTLASATVKVEQREKSKAGWDVVLASKSGGLALVSLAFPGDKQNLLVGDTTAGSAGSGNSSTVAP